MISISYLEAGLFATAIGLIIIAAILMQVMIGQVNLRVPEEARISPFFDYPGKQFRIIREYKRLYPRGRLAVAFIASTALGFVVFAAFFIEFVLH